MAFMRSILKNCAESTKGRNIKIILEVAATPSSFFHGAETAAPDSSIMRRAQGI